MQGCRVKKGESERRTRGTAREGVGVSAEGYTHTVGQQRGHKKQQKARGLQARPSRRAAERAGEGGAESEGDNRGKCDAVLAFLTPVKKEEGERGNQKEGGMGVSSSGSTLHVSFCRALVTTAQAVFILHSPYRNLGP